MKDLGIIYESKFELNLYFNTVVSKVFKLLDFVKRPTKEFKNIHTLGCLLFIEIINPFILLYCSQIWSPAYNIYIKKN